MINKSKYDYVIIGTRIRQERERKNMSQDELAEQLEIKSRQTIGKWENGESCPSLDNLVDMCNCFKCDMGYLLGEYNERTRISCEITTETGLSEAAVETLLRLKPNNDIENEMFQMLDVLNFIMEDHYIFMMFLDNLALYLQNPFDTPCHYDEEKGIYVESYDAISQSPIVVSNGQKHIAIGKKLNYQVAGQDAYMTKHVSVSILESHAMLIMQKIINEWQRNYRLER